MPRKTRAEIPPPQSTDDSGDQYWQQMRGLYPNDPRLTPTFVYAIPKSLATLLHEQIPSVLPQEDLEFEHRLRELAGSGFRNQKAFGYEVLDSPFSSEVGLVGYPDVRDRMFAEANLKLQHVLAPGEHRNGLKASRDQLAARMAERLGGFCGWLVTNPHFRNELTEVENAWCACGTLRFAFPDLGFEPGPPSLPGVLERSKQNAAVRVALDFLKKWNLVRMDTWDLPVPIAPTAFGDESRIVSNSNKPVSANAVHSMGVSLFIPWSLLADQNLRIQEVIAFHRQRQDLSHLATWTSDCREGTWGVERQAKMLKLFVYCELAIKARYDVRIRGKTTKLDRVFREWWGPSTADEHALTAAAESVRKIRAEMQKRLGKKRRPKPD